MHIKHTIQIDNLAEMLTGKKVLKSVDPWKSQIRALSKAITFVENDPLLAPKLLSHPFLQNLPKPRGRIIGITGLPGAGKSSLTNLIIKALRSKNKSVAVFAVDPSSSLSGGAVLGDRIRMQDHFRDPYVFIRSQGARGALGGIAQSTRSVIRLSSLLGFDYILVETVGVGQSESDVVNIADTSMLVLMPNSGDEIQLMKAGILQLAQIYVVNKCDLSDPSRMVQELEENTLPEDEKSWRPHILKVSATEKHGITELIDAIFAHEDFENQDKNARKLTYQRVKKEIMQNLLFITENNYKEHLNNLDENTLEKIHIGKTTAMAIAQSLLNNGTKLFEEKNEDHQNKPLGRCS